MLSLLFILLVRIFCNASSRNRKEETKMMTVVYIMCGIGALALLIAGAANNYTYIEMES